MREACLILRNHLNDDARALKSKEVVRACMLPKASSHSHSYGIRLNHNFQMSMKTAWDFLPLPPILLIAFDD